MVTPLQVYLRIKEINRISGYIPTHLIINEFRGDADVLKSLEALIEMKVLNAAFYRLGEIRLTLTGPWPPIGF